MQVREGNGHTHDDWHQENSRQNVTPKASRNRVIQHLIFLGAAPNRHDRKPSHRYGSGIEGPSQGQVGLRRVDCGGEWQNRYPKQKNQIQKQEPAIVSNNVSKNSDVADPIDSDQKETHDISDQNWAKTKKRCPKFSVVFNLSKFWNVQIQDEQRQNDTENAIAKISDPFKIRALIFKLFRKNHSQSLFVICPLLDPTDTN